MGRIDGRVAVVTGGANGIGRACCERFADEGADVVVGDIQESSAVVAAVAERGRRALGIHLDSRSISENESLMQAAFDHFGRLDIVVTAAGIPRSDYWSGDIEAERAHQALTRPGMPDRARDFADLGFEEWQAVLDVNLNGTFLALRAAARQMLAQGRGGSIITISSVAAKNADAGTPPYCVSKAGVWMLTKQAARALGSAGIRVNSVAPGVIETNMSVMLKEIPGALEGILSTLSLQRVGTPVEVANAALFLAGDESSYLTGSMLHPDGGGYHVD